MHSVPGIGFISTATLIRINNALKLSEIIMIIKAKSITYVLLFFFLKLAYISFT